MILYVENPKASTKKKKLAELINEFIKGAGYSQNAKVLHFYTLTMNNLKRKL